MNIFDNDTWRRGKKEILRLFANRIENQWSKGSRLPEAASKPLKAAIENHQRVCSFWQDVKEATGTRKHNENDLSSTGNYVRDSNCYTMADCSDMLRVNEPPSNQDITTPNSKTIHGEPIEGRRIFYGNRLFTEI
ncbi:hypothetical protein PR048_015554 [Dryococelus australis]|uniref:Uncharacterized protein n=1 Tax=Dryococelus australis TaxID=614101 RepID=A0ABQ9HHE6_9NEOP|nr:hypothetical protein PR048_015554 [Dryococelus australis]